MPEPDWTDTGVERRGSLRRASLSQTTTTGCVDILDFGSNNRHFGFCTLPFDQSSQMHSTDMRRDRPRVSDKSRDAVEGPTHDRRGLIKSRPDLLLRLRVN